MIFLSLRLNFLKLTTVNVNTRKTDDDNTEIFHVFEMRIVMNAGAVLHQLSYQASWEQVSWVLLPVGLIAQMVEHCTCITCRGQGSNHRSGLSRWCISSAKMR